ncbi:MAG: phosphatidate cytidylyltransferase [Halopseudomonas sp.]|uniref:phosphatidate cytidylyltransferase n=1 Tax=Halopseudomonas sp. TaxID=2901191 RepID=UPI0030039673
MLKQRVITAVILAPLAIAGFVLLQGAWFAFFIGAVVAVGAWEWARLCGETRQSGRVVYALTLGLFMVGLYRDQWPVIYYLIPALVWWLFAALMVVRYPAGSGIWKGSFLRQVFGLLILLPAWAGLVWLRAQAEGLWLIFALLILVWAADIGAYFAGKQFGRTKLMPNVSPGKTREGLLGGLLVSELLAFATMLYLGWGPVAMLLGALGAALVVLFSVVGDLTESLFKREEGLKDSSNLLPGHGGVLDRIDSLTAAIPVFVACWLLIGSYLE